MRWKVSKARPSAEQRRIENLIRRLDALTRRAFRTFLREARSTATLREISNLLARGDVEGAMRIVDSHVVTLSRSITDAAVIAGDAEIIALAGRLASRARGLALSFDPTNPSAAAALREQSLAFIREFSDEQRRAVRQALDDALSRTGAGVQSQARAFRDAIGLTQRQELAVRNYRRLLQEGNAEALTRALRDRRFDRSVARAAAGEKALTGEQIERMVARYRARYLDYRAETIARTEGLKAASLGREQALSQAIGQASVQRELVVRRWVTNLDGRERESHAAMNGQEVGLDEPFISGDGHRLMYPGDGPPDEAINCRCVVTYRVKQISELGAA